MLFLPSSIPSGAFTEGHVQGIAVDPSRGYVYYSFTTVLIKTDLQGRLLGSVIHLAGHLGCITFDAARNRVYGSLEMKHDSIGKGIISRTGWDASAEDAFYLVSFDCDAITEMNMDAESAGVMKAVYLQDVVKDYAEIDEISARPHRYGCSGIDGTALGPRFGDAPDSEPYIMIAYGIYSETDRDDNDYQVILSYPPEVIDTYGAPLNQSAPHHSGPPQAAERFFFYTGNTVFGVQNLEYAPAIGAWLVAVYQGKKPTFENFPLFFIDANTKPALAPLRGRGEEQGLVLTAAPIGAPSANPAIRGSYFPYGQTGVSALPDGSFYFSHNADQWNTHTHQTTLHRYTFSPAAPELFALFPG